ncbi:YciI family protein [Antribacter gilvus]|uniref:YciI family protein n=1 Tax=Antribacter gilvus TaxID=2304675 RepID=UPI000F77B20E|nr:YciI family protein [Antribacter gilvus]
MRYLVLTAEKPGIWAAATEGVRQTYFDAHSAFSKAVGERATMVAGEALAEPDAATTLRRTDGRVTFTDGPFAETEEQIGGFYLLDADNLDIVTDLCALLPASYTIEIRPVVTIEGFEG